MVRSLIVCLTACLFSGTALATDFPLPEQRGDLRVLVLGDFNGPYGTVGYSSRLLGLLERVADFDADLVLLPGDLIAGQDHSLPDGRFSEMWAGFDAEVATALELAGLPFAAALGNHDGSSLRSEAGVTFARERDAAATYWLSARDRLGLAPADISDYPFNWSFTFGELFVVVWDASSAMITEAQREWLWQELAGEQAQAAAFRWLVGHLPLVGVAERRDRPGEVIADGARLARELVAAGVDTYVSGHQAAYYPGELEGLQLLMSGGIGGRALISGGVPVRSTVTLVDLWTGSGEVSYTTYDIASGQTVAATELPQVLDAFGGTIRRSVRAR